MKGKHTDISRKLYSHGRGNQEQRRKVQRERIEDETTDENCLFFFFFFCVDETGTVLVVEFGER